MSVRDAIEATKELLGRMKGGREVERECVATTP
jgi:hypothetical protein